MKDRSRIVGQIRACASEERRKRTLTLLGAAVSDLRAAEAARLAGNPVNYLLPMRKVFGNESRSSPACSPS